MNPTNPTNPTTWTDGGRHLSSALGDAVTDLYARGSDSAKAAAIWAEVVGPVGSRHTRGIFVKESGREGVPPALYVYLDSNAFVYEYRTDRLLYEQRLAHLGFPVSELVPRLSRSAGSPTPSRAATAPVGMGSGEPKGRPLDELQPLDERREQWAKSSVTDLPKDLGDAVYRAMTSSMRRNQEDGR